jgi:hypothetical protein
VSDDTKIVFRVNTHIILHISVTTTPPAPEASTEAATDPVIAIAAESDVTSEASTGPAGETVPEARTVADLEIEVENHLEPGAADEDAVAADDLSPFAASRPGADLMRLLFGQKFSDFVAGFGKKKNQLLKSPLSIK